MARCVIYERLLDAKTLPEFEHVFEFNTIVKIKEEVENDPLETDIGQSIEPSCPETIGIYADPKPEHDSTVAPELQTEESQAAPYPKLVIKFRDLWGVSETQDIPVKRKKRQHKDIANDILDQCDIRPTKRRKRNLTVGLKNHGPRSSSSKLKVTQRNAKKQNGTFILSQKELTSERKEMQDIWNLTRITHLENNSQILCECCGRSFPTIRHLEAHIRYYTADGIFKCTLCNRKFNRNFQLKRHMKAVHTDNPNRRVYRYKCQLCHDQFEKKPGLIAHVTHFHHQRVYLKRKEETAVRRRKNKSLVGRAKKIKSQVPANKVKLSSEPDPKNDATSPVEKLFVDTNDGKEQFIPASLKIEQQYGICNEIVRESKDPEQISIKLECDEELMGENEFDRWERQMREDAAQQSTSQLHGNLIDHLGNTVGNWCVSKSVDQLEGANDFSSANRAGITVISGVQNRNMKPSSTCSSYKSGTLKSLLENRFDNSAIDDAARLALARNKRGANVRGEFIPLSKLLDTHMGIVSPHKVLETMETLIANVTNVANGELSEINSSEISCESVSTRKKADVESANTRLKNSSTFIAQDIVSRKKFNASSKYKLKDVRVSLVKLENMIKLPKLTSNPVEDGKFYCVICDKYFTSKRGLKKHCERIHESKNKSNEASQLAAEKTKINDKCTSEELSKNIQLEKQGNSSTASTLNTHCLLCDEVFQNKFSVVSHLIAVHTKAGRFRCCLCDELKKTSRNLRFHLYKHFKNDHEQNGRKSCVICAKKLNIFNLSPHCLECKEQLKPKKRRVAHVRDSEKKAPVVEKKYVSLRKKTLPSFLRDSIVTGIRIADNQSVKNKSDISTADNRSAKNETSVSTTDNQSAKNKTNFSTDIVKNFKCLACNRVFLESGRLKHHLLTAHVDVEYCERETNRKIDSKIKNENTRPKLTVGLKTTAKCKVSSICDKSREKKSRVRGKSKVIETNAKKKQCVRQRHLQSGTKTCYTRKCDVCGLNCCCQMCLRIHKKRYSSEGNNSCKKCSITFAQKNLLALHLKTAHNSKIIFNEKLKCQICTQGFRSKKFLRIHFAHFHSKKYLDCKTCGIIFNSSRELNNHRQYYSEIGSCLCSSCGQTFRCKYMLEYHNAQVHDYGEPSAYKYSCGICNCAFLDKLLLQAHVGHFHNVNNDQSRKKVVIKHFGQVEERKLEDTEFWLESENYFPDSNAPTNDSTFQTDALDKTLQLAHLPIEYKCTLCKLSFTNPLALLNHEWEYSNDGDYVCSLCNRKFMTETHVINHKIKHYQRNAIRKYDCYVCKEDFLRANDLAMHGLHLHGPQFISRVNSKAIESLSSSESNHQVTEDHENIIEKSCISNTNDNIELSTDDRDSQNGTILLFQKLARTRLSINLLRRQSNENSHCCEFCQENFTSASLLKDHMKTHTYHAYYTNLLRYLCLICKKKFRTNDILRAHVVHFHPSDQKQSILDKSVCPVSNKSVKFEVMNMSESLPLEHTMSDPTVCSKEKSNSFSQPNITLPKKRERVFHAVNNTNTFQAHRVCRTYPAPKIRSQPNTNSKCNDTVSKEDENPGDSNLSQQINSKVALRLDTELTSQAVKLFTLKVENPNDSREYTCIICIETFGTVTQFAKHFNNVHIKDHAYVCALCEQRFAYMSDLKQHIIKHEQDPTRYMCCNKKFTQITGLIYHKQSHAEKDEKNQDVPGEDLSQSDAIGYLEISNDESNVPKTVNVCKCEICDAAFTDFRVLLKHWDACIIKNCLQCGFCGARFKGQNFLEVHKLTCDQNKQNPHLVQKRCSNTVRNNLPRARDMVDNLLPVNLNPFKERRKYGPANKLSMQRGSSNVKRNTNDKKECDLNEEQKTNTNMSITNPRSSQAEVSSDQRNVQKIGLTKMSMNNVANNISLNINSQTHTRNLPRIISNNKTSSKITRETNDKHSTSDLSDQDFSRIGNKSNVANNAGQRKIQKRLTPSLNTVKNPTLNKPAIRSSIIVKSARVRSDQNSGENNGKDTALLNLKAQSLNTANDRAPSPVYYLCVESTLNDSDEINSRTVIPNDSDLGFCINEITKNEQLILQNSPNVPSSIHDSNTQEATGNSTKSSKKKTKSDAVALQSHTIIHKHKEAPISSSLLGNATPVDLPLSHKSTIRDIDSPTDDSDYDEGAEPIASNRNFRCSYCSAWFSEREKLTEHLEAHKAARQCPACGIVFSNESALREHLPEHERSTCTKCSTITVFRDSQAYYEGNYKYCSTCKSLLPVPSRKSDNLQASSEREVMKCGVCMEVFDSMSKLSAHFRAVHLSFVCLICQARFSTKYTLRNHLHTHDKQHTSVTNKCKTCINNFAEEVNLEDDSNENALFPEMVQPDPYV